jgi:hypothetical protein
VGADGLIKYAGVNEPRFDHDPVTGESLGLLIEESRTNLLTYSQELDNSSWTKTGITCTANVADAPDGTTTADKIIINNGGTEGNVRRTSLFTNGVVSFYAKPAGFDFIGGEAHIGGGNYPKYRVKLLTGECSAESGLSISTQSVGNGWLRISVVGDFDNNAFIISPRNDYVFGYTGIVGADGVKGLFLWGAQVEAGAFPTSYIPTTTATVTRRADVASITGTNFRSFYVNTGSTILAHGRSLGPSFTGTECIVGVGGFSNGAQIRETGTDMRGMFRGTYNLGVDAISGLLPSGLRKMCIAFAPSTNGVFAMNGIVYGGGKSAAALDYPGGGMGLGASGELNTQWNGTITRITYWPKRLPNSQLQALTR